MPIFRDWLNEEQTIIVIRPHGRWTWGEYIASADDSMHMLDTVDHPVDIVLDWSQTASWPLNTFLHGRNMLSRRHPHIGTYVFTGMNPVMKGMWETFQRLYSGVFKGVEVITANTVDEALARLAERRTSR